MKSILSAGLLLSSVALFAQEEKGMHFEHGQTWAQIQAKAKAENKYIFVDAFTTWCGPCKMMAKNIFPQEPVGDFFNANYINLKVQLDTTAKDNDEVKGWYKDAHDIMVNYKVRVFPTYLFFSPDGQLVHRAVGSSEATAFIEKGKDALDSTKQYYTLARKYETGEKSPAFLQKLARAAQNAYDKPGMDKYSAEYLATQSDLLTKENIEFLKDFTESSKDAGFKQMLTNTAAFDKVLGAGKTDGIIKNIILREEVFPALFARDGSDPDWTKLTTSITTKYPKQAPEVISQSKVIFYNRKADWPNFSKAFTAHVKAYGKNISAQELNQYAWAVFEGCNDIACVNQALEWSKKSVDLSNDPMFMDTYANLLHKTGKKAEAIKWEEKAIAILKSKNESYTEYEATLEKIKKGEKTW